MLKSVVREISFVTGDDFNQFLKELGEKPYAVPQGLFEVNPDIVSGEFSQMLNRLIKQGHMKSGWYNFSPCTPLVYRDRNCIFETDWHNPVAKIAPDWNAFDADIAWSNYCAYFDFVDINIVPQASAHCHINPITTFEDHRLQSLVKLDRNAPSEYFIQQKQREAENRKRQGLYYW